MIVKVDTEHVERFALECFGAGEQVEQRWDRTTFGHLNANPDAVAPSVAYQRYNDLEALRVDTRWEVDPLVVEIVDPAEVGDLAESVAL